MAMPLNARMVKLYFTLLVDDLPHATLYRGERVRRSAHAPAHLGLKFLNDLSGSVFQDDAGTATCESPRIAVDTECQCPVTPADANRSAIAGVLIQAVDGQDVGARKQFVEVCRNVDVFKLDRLLIRMRGTRDLIVRRRNPHSRGRIAACDLGAV